MEQKLESFPPILPKNPKVLVLGSMPSVRSLEQQQYYGNPRNHFWPILFTLFNEVQVDSYEEKLSFIKSKNIAIWDMIKTCFRKGSLDANIVDDEPNDIAGLLDEYPTIKLIACNGTKSFHMFQRNISLEHHPIVDVIKLPSTSPIPGKYTKSFAGKVEAWSQILKYL